MVEEEAKSVQNQEVAAPDVKSEDQNQAQAQQTKEPEVGSKEYNWRQLQKKNEELERKVQTLLKLEEERNKPTPLPEDEELKSLVDDDIITVGHFKKLAQKQTEEAIKKVLEQKEKASLPEKTKSKYQDFDLVMTEDNIRKFETEEPGLAEACARAANPWEATYKILKKFVLPQTAPSNEKGEKKIIENSSKPVSANTVGRVSPLSNANVWAEASKEELYKEMMSAARSAR